MKAEEIFINQSYENYHQLVTCITNLILDYEPKLTKESILCDINTRNKQGEGLMTPSILSMHVQDELVDRDIVFYVTLDNKYKYFSQNLNQEFSIDKLVIIVVNPHHKLDHLSKIGEFIE